MNLKKREREIYLYGDSLEIYTYSKLTFYLFFLKLNINNYIYIVHQKQKF